MILSESPRIELIHGDCIDYMNGLEAKAFELAIVDPPYGIERFKKGGSHLNKYGSEKADWNNIKPTDTYFSNLFKVSASQIIWGGNNFKLPTSEYFIVWKKSNAQDFSFAMCEMAWTNCKIPAKIFTHLHVQCNDNRIHPTQKPVKLYRWLLQNYAKQGDRILDTHLGSGSSAIAAFEEGFDFVGIELDREYYDGAVRRFRDHVSQGRLF